MAGYNRNSWLLLFVDGSYLRRPGITRNNNKRVISEISFANLKSLLIFEVTFDVQVTFLTLSVNLLFSAVAFYLWSYFFSEVHFHLWNYLDSLNLFFRFALLSFISEVAFNPWNIICEIILDLWSINILTYLILNFIDLWS